MRIRQSMLVPEGTPDDAADVRTCKVEGERTWHVPQKVMVFSAGGARSMRLWTCENHPLPATITDQPDEE